MSDFNSGFAHTIVPQEMKNMRISVNNFIAAYNSDEAELIDIRIATETRVWSLGFGLKIPANELPERLSELPRDKLLVVACPMTDRSNMARTYLASQGLHVKYLQGGLLALMDHLKGGAAEEIMIDP